MTDSRTSIRLIATLWLISAVMLAGGRLADISELKSGGMVLSLGYILVLIWWVTREAGQTTRQLDVPPLLARPQGFVPMLVGILALVFATLALTAGYFRNGWYMVWISTLPALAVAVRLRDRYRASTIALGIAVVVVLFSLGTVHRSPGWALAAALAIGIHLVAGVALLRYTGCGTFQLVDGNYVTACRSLGLGAVLAVPPALLNIALAEGAGVVPITDPAGDWWLPFLAVQPGLTEEIWARLFLVTMFVALLAPVSRDRPRRVVAVAGTLAVFVHVLAHVPQSITDVGSVIFVSLLYGIPLVVLFLARDLEHAIGYHVLIDLVRFVVFPPF